MFQNTKRIECIFLESIIKVQKHEIKSYAFTIIFEVLFIWSRESTCIMKFICSVEELYSNGTFCPDTTTYKTKAKAY